MPELTQIELVIFLLSFAAFSYFVVLRSSLSLAPWVPTHKRDFERVATALDLQPSERLLEAGCGDARVAVYLARNNPNITVVGYELSPVLFVWGWARAKLSGLPNVSICYGDVLRQDLRPYDVVYAYALTRTVNQKLLPKAKQELKPGARLVSYAFAIAGDEQVSADTPPDATNLYVYHQPK